MQRHRWTNEQKRARRAWVKRQDALRAKKIADADAKDRAIFEARIAAGIIKSPYKALRRSMPGKRAADGAPGAPLGTVDGRVEGAE